MTGVRSLHVLPFLESRDDRSKITSCAPISIESRDDRSKIISCAPISVV